MKCAWHGSLNHAASRIVIARDVNGRELFRVATCDEHGMSIEHDALLYHCRVISESIDEAAPLTYIDSVEVNGESNDPLYRVGRNGESNRA